MRAFVKFLFLFIFFFLLNIFFIDKIRSVGGFFVCNKGISFNINIDPWIFWLILIIFSLVILFNIIKYKNKTISTYFQLLLIGIFLNALDRLIYGCVIDYFYINFLRLPFFNLGDIFILLSTSLIIHNLLTNIY